MSSQEETDGDPIMLVITDLLSPGPLKIARITRNVTLPRLLPVATLAATGAGAIVGLLFGFILRSIGILPGDIITSLGLSSIVGAGIAYAIINVKIGGQTLWQYAKLRFSATLKSRTKINDTVPRIVEFDADEPPPVDGYLVAANPESVVYAVPGRIGKSGRVYANIAPLATLTLGEVTILESTVPVKQQRDCEGETL